MISKIWAMFLSLAAIIWLVEAVTVWFGFKPEIFTMSIAFIITAGTLSKWAVEAWNEK